MMRLISRVILGAVIAALFWCAPASAQSYQWDGVTTLGLHPSAQHRPVIVPTYEVLPDGRIIQEFEVESLEAVDRSRLPDLSPTAHGPAATQAVMLRGFPASSSWSSYTVRTVLVSCELVDGYAAENLTTATFGGLAGGSYYVPRLRALNPQRPDPGGTWQLFAVSLTRSWDLGQVAPFDGAFNYAGASGKRNDTAAQLSGTHTQAQYPLRAVLASSATVPIYVVPELESTYIGWPLASVRTALDGKPLSASERVGPGGGHGGFWPWAHEMRLVRAKFRVEFWPI